MTKYIIALILIFIIATSVFINDLIKENNFEMKRTIIKEISKNEAEIDIQNHDVKWYISGEYKETDEKYISVMKQEFKVTVKRSDCDPSRYWLHNEYTEGYNTIIKQHVINTYGEERWNSVKQMVNCRNLPNK